MFDLTIVKHNGVAYIDSRQAAKAIDKRHDNLLRDINKYREIIARSGLLKIEESDFFVESSYINDQNKRMPCYLLSKMGCELVANKLTGEKGVLFTTAYVMKFNQMEAAEREEEIKAHSKPRLSEFNSAVKNVLNGMMYCFTAPKRVMDFLCGVYKPLGIEVPTDGCLNEYYSVTEIAEQLRIYSENGRPHGHAVSAIIAKLGKTENHAIAVPYGLAGVSLHYDRYIMDLVQKWIYDNNFPREVPHLNFDYHIYYTSQLSLFDDYDED